MTLKETLENLDGETTKVGLRMEGGLTVEIDGKWKKYGIAPEMWQSVNPGQDAVEVLDVLQALLQAVIANYLKPIEEHWASAGAVVENEAIQTDMAPIEGIADEVRWISPTSFYVHRSQGKQPIAFFKDNAEFEEKGATCFAETFKASGLNLYEIEPGKSYDPADYDIGKVALQMNAKGDWVVAKFGGLL